MFTSSGTNVTSTSAIAVKTITPNGSYGGNVAVNTTVAPAISGQKTSSKTKIKDYKKKSTDIDFTKVFDD